MKRLPSTSTISAPSPRAMKIGSRPIARMARTGELTPPGMSASARRYCSAERVSVSDTVTGSRSSVPALPGREVLGEVQQPDLLELRGGVQRGALADAGARRDRVEHRITLLARAPVRHREDRVWPVRIGGPLIAMRHSSHGRHARAELGDLLLRHLPYAHPVRRESGPAVVEDRGHAPQQPALLHACEVLEETLLAHPQLGRSGGV